MYPWEQALEDICSLEFSVRLNVVSSLDNFIRVLPDEPEVQCLVKACREPDQFLRDPFNTILKTMYSLLSERPDINYENPHDTILTTLGFILILTNPDTTETVIDILNKVPQGFYTKQFATKLRKNLAYQ